MFHSDRITSVHLAVTDRCNASCPMCPRTTNGGPLNPYLKNTEMTLEEAQEIFNPEFLKQLHFIQLCGNFGDPMVAKEVIEILEYFREVNPNISLGFHTNGSGRTPEWWHRLGQILSKPGDYCKFGIDGLEDTNHIYRRRTRWNKIMTAVECFVAAGGIAHWEFLVFRHNEHQVETARDMAKQMGFEQFFVKKTSRFFDYKTGKNVAFPIFDKNGETVDHLYPPIKEDFINPVSNFVEKSMTEESPAVEAAPAAKEPPVTSEPQEAPAIVPEATAEVAAAAITNEDALGAKMKERTKEAVENSKTLKQNFESLEDYFKRTQVSCISIKDKSIYISASGSVYPCCFIGGQIAYPDRGIDGDRLEQIAMEQTGSLEAINAKVHRVQDIINGAWFKSISDMWEPDCSEERKVGTCSRMCGKHITLVSGEYA